MNSGMALCGHGEGADGRAFAEALERARGEFIEMPDLRLTEAQAARLWSVDVALCSAILSELVDRGFLMKRKRARFSRP